MVVDDPVARALAPDAEIAVIGRVVCEVIAFARVPSFRVRALVWLRDGVKCHRWIGANY